MLGALVGAALALAIALMAVPSSAQDDSFQDLNTILRGLAPVEYLPEHAGRPSIDLDVRFRLGSAELTAAAMRQLDELAAAMRSQALAESRFRIAGHTDASGAAAYNLVLSQRRAAAVKAYLVHRHGIAAARLDTVGWGEERLKDPLNPESGVNRRVEVVALGAAEGGLGDQSAAPAPADVFALLAGELLDGLGATVPRATRIAIWPFRDDEIPISPATARSFNDSLLAALFRGARGGYAFVGRDELRTVIRELTESGDPDENPVAAVAESAAADVLIVGSFGLGRGQLSVAYKALGVSGDRIGRILAITRPYSLDIDPRRANLSLDQGLVRASRAFADGAPAMIELRLAGIHFQTSRIQTEFGRYVERKMADALVEVFSSAITGGALIVKRAELSEAQVAAMRGIDVDDRSLEPENFEARPGVFVLSGNYWDFGGSAELRLVLADAGGRSLAWRELVQPPAGMAVQPPGYLPAALLDNDNLGPVRLTLSSARGDQPVYRVGEQLYPLIETDHNAWLYCFYRQSDRQWFKIFPNAYYNDPVVRGHRMHTIPDENYPFDFNITEPAGTDLVKCFAVDRDIAYDLPPVLRSLDGGPLPAGMDTQLPGTFRALRDAQVTESSLVITVER